MVTIITVGFLAGKNTKRTQTNGYDNGEIEKAEDLSCDVRITIGEKTYLLNKTSGIFTMESKGEPVVSMLNEETLAWFLQTYGFFLA